MKSFTTIVAFAASATIVRAQAVFNQSTGQFSCSIPNGNFCASDSLQASIIIRCTNGVGYAGNCNDDEAGEPPLGVNYAPCWQSSPTAGNAACMKNCIVHPDAGGRFSLASCSATPISSFVPVPTTTVLVPSNVTETSYPSVTTVTVPCHKCQGGVTTVTVPCLTSLFSTVPAPTVPVPTGGWYPTTNGTQSSYIPVSSPTTSSTEGTTVIATATPILPTATVSTFPTYTGAATTARAGSALAIVGLFAAYFL